MSAKANRRTDAYMQQLHELAPGVNLTCGVNDRDFDHEEYLVQTLGNTYLVDAGSQYALDRGCKRLLFEIERTEMERATNSQMLRSLGPSFVNACSDSEPEGFDG